MEIKYMQLLKENNSLGVVTDIPMTLLEIEQLEQLYNNGNQMPIPLRELLFLAGKSCSAINTGWPTPFEGQIEVRQWLTSANKTISRPFFGFDPMDFNQFSLVYLDDPRPDPMVYHVTIEEGFNNNEMNIYTSGFSLSNLINHLINTRLTYGTF